MTYLTGSGGLLFNGRPSASVQLLTQARPRFLTGELLARQNARLATGRPAPQRRATGTWGAATGQLLADAERKAAAHQRNTAAFAQAAASITRNHH